jgi:hypothetical protein
MVRTVYGLPSASESEYRQKAFSALRHLSPVTLTVGLLSP